MQVKFGYCVICDNGSDRTNRAWVDELIKKYSSQDEIIVTSCHSCELYPKENKNLLKLLVNIPEVM